MTDIKQLAEVCDLVQTESESQTATLADRVLTPEAQAERDDFQAEYGYDGNCSCHISPPCNSCIHPGNPRNQEEDEAAWVADGCGACGDACASNGGDCRVKEESPPVCESVQAGGESQTGQSDDPVLHALGVMTRVASAARDLLHESEEFDFPDGLGRGAPQRLWDALGSEIEAAENDGAPIDDEMPPADPALLASANRMLFDRLEGVAHVLRGCGLPALRDQKPVAVYKGHRHIPSDTKEFWGMADNHLPAGTHLYARPVLSRELTDKVIERLFDESAFQENEMRDAADYFAHEIERYLKGEGE